MINMNMNMPIFVFAKKKIKMLKYDSVAVCGERGGFNNKSSATEYNRYIKMSSLKEYVTSNLPFVVVTKVGSGSFRRKKLWIR